MYKLVLIRHGESTWNLENRFTGWVDVDLTPLGVTQAQAAGRLLKKQGFDFDIAYTSVLKRAVWTLWHTLDQMDRHSIDKALIGFSVDGCGSNIRSGCSHCACCSLPGCGTSMWITSKPYFLAWASRMGMVSLP